MRFVDCQGLAGFMTLGFVQAGYELVHRTGTLDFGNHMINANRDLVGDGWDATFNDDVESWHAYRDVQVVAGLPPCSSWSAWTGGATSRLKDNKGADAKALQHTWALIRYAAMVKPDVVVYESVQQAYTKGHETMRAMRALLESSSETAYDLHHVRMNNLLVGGKSYRPRYFWVAVKSGIKFGTRLPELDSAPGIMDTIGDLQTSVNTWDFQPYVKQPSQTLASQVSRRGGFDGHKTEDSVHTRRLIATFDALHANGETWEWGESHSYAIRKAYQLTGELPGGDELWGKRKTLLLERNFDMGYTQPYRWPGDKWANVLTGGALNLVVHPTQSRGLTHRECARIQGLPDDWRIKPSREYRPMSDAWGKAVSVDAGRWIAQQVKSSLEGDPGDTGELIGDREWMHQTDKGFSRQAAAKRFFPETVSKNSTIKKVYDVNRWPVGSAKLVD